MGVFRAFLGCAGDWGFWSDLGKKGGCGGVGFEAVDDDGVAAHVFIAVKRRWRQ